MKLVLIYVLLKVSSVFTNKNDVFLKTWKECAKGTLSVTCIKIGVINTIAKLNNDSELDIAPGVTLVKSGDENLAMTNYLHNVEYLAAEEKLNDLLIVAVGSFLDSHSLKFKLLDDGAVGEARQLLEEGRKKKLFKFKSKGNIGVIIAMALMMKGTMMSLGLGALALLAGKALLTAIMSLVLSAVLGLKSLTSGKSTTYEIVAKPVYTQSHSHSTGHEDVSYGGHSAYGRSFGGRR